MNNKIPIILAKTITLVVALGVMFFWVADAHEEQKKLAEKNSTLEKNNTEDNKHIRTPPRVFFQSSKIINKSVVSSSAIGIKIDAKGSRRVDVNKSKQR